MTLLAMGQDQRELVLVSKRFLTEVYGERDVMMFNHSLEHVADSAAGLTAVASRLVLGGLCFVRIPTTSSEAWELYGADWVRIDAPRHVFVPSRRGMARLAKRVGLVLERAIDDSTAFQFIGSEFYRKGVPLFRESNGSLRASAPEAHFSRKEIRRWVRRSAELNAAGRGDQCAFLLRNAPEV